MNFMVTYVTQDTDMKKRKKKVLSLVTCLNCTYILKYISNSSDNPMPILGILE